MYATKEEDESVKGIVRDAVRSKARRSGRETEKKTEREKERCRKGDAVEGRKNIQNSENIIIFRCQ